MNESNVPVKTWSKNNGEIQMFTDVYVGVNKNGSVRMSSKWSDCLEFINGHKINRAQA